LGWARRAVRRILRQQLHQLERECPRIAAVIRNMKLRIVAGLLFLCFTLAAFGQQGASRGSWIGHLFGYGFLFQVAAVIHWARKRPEGFWLWIIIIGGIIGALAYFLIEGLPDFRNVQRALRGPSRRNRIHYLRALVIQNPSAGNYEELGELLLDEKRYGDAREAFDRALSVRTDSIDPFYRRGIAEFELGDDEAAVTDLRRVTAADWRYDFYRAACLLGQALARLGRAEEAMATFDQLVRSASGAEPLVAAAEFFADHGRPAEALEIATGIAMRDATMPHYQKRRDRVWLRRARALKRGLGKKV
jgi:hypothetical protein